MNNKPLLPFYSGQPVVCVDPIYELIKGNKYIVARCYVDCCGDVVVELQGILDKSETGSIIVSGQLVMCGCQRHIVMSSGLHPYRAFRFRPYQEQKFPLIKLSKVIEKVEICSN